MEQAPVKPKSTDLGQALFGNGLSGYLGESFALEANCRALGVGAPKTVEFGPDNPEPAYLQVFHWRDPMWQQILSRRKKR